MAAPELDLDPKGGPFGIAASGGADSLALLLSCHAEGLAARVATVDHGLRPEAAAEAAFVADLCARAGIPHDTIRLDLRDGPGLMARAREARYAALADWSLGHRLSAVLLGHTATDAAESLLMRLSDGAGLDGLAAMETSVVRFGATFLRPLHASFRPDLLAYVESLGVDPVQDPSNSDPRFERARARRLMSKLGLDAMQLAASAAALRSVRRSVRATTDRIVAQRVTMDRGDWFVPRDAWRRLRAEDEEQARRVLLAGLRAIAGGDYPPRRAEQEEMMRRMTAEETTTLAGCLLTFGVDGLRLSREPARASAAPPAVLGGVWDGRWRISARHVAPDGLRVRALGDAVSRVDWRATGLPRRSVMAGPAVWDGAALHAAPLAEPDGWITELRDQSGAWREIGP